MSFLLLQSIIRKTVRLIHLQFFITLLCLPICAYWGLFISPAIIIGNILFIPFLTLFLSISTLLFFSHIAHIPHGPLDYCLDLITRIWVYFLETGIYIPQVAYAQPDICSVVILILIAFCILIFRPIATPYKNIATLICAIIATSYYLHAPNTLHAHHAEKNIHYTLIVEKNIVTYIDHGFIGKSENYNSWIKYTIIPQILRQTGSSTINHLIVTHITERTFKALTELLEKMHIETLYIPYWKGMLKRSTWNAYKELYEQAHQKNCTIKRLSQYEMKIMLSEKDHIIISPHRGVERYKTITYPRYTIVSSIDNRSTVLYDPKKISSQKRN